MEQRPVLHPGQDHAHGLTSREIRRRLAASVPGRRRSPADPTLPGSLPHSARGDHDLNPGMQPKMPLRMAAVLIGLIDGPDGVSILLTRRTDNLTDHAGQISFPGGRIDPDDPHPEAAALREAAEEVALDAGRAMVIGRLDTYVTRTGYEIVPVVALLSPPLSLIPDPSEVAEIFELPLDELMRPGALFLHSQRFDEIERWYYALDWQGRHIWGATAGMLNNLIEVLGASA